MRALATTPAARGLLDDAAVAAWPLGADIVATHDMLVEGVHFTADCPPQSLAWKLVAVNLSDLAAMGARPVGLLTGVGFGPAADAGWCDAFAAGLEQALSRLGVALWGGDVVRAGERLILSATALGQVAAGAAVARDGARDGDTLWVSGSIGDAGLGLQVALGAADWPPAVCAALLKRYRWPTPRLALGRALAGIAHAMMDVSDGLLIDAGRMAAASGLGVALESAHVPLSDAARATGVPVARLAAMGDDYELLFATAPQHADQVRALAAAARVPVTAVGRFVRAPGVRLDGVTPERLGWLHDQPAK